jgi:hypothetical protein
MRNSSGRREEEGRGRGTGTGKGREGKERGRESQRRERQGSTLRTVRLPETTKSGCWTSRFPCKLARWTTNFFVDI